MWLRGYKRPKVSPFKDAERRMQKVARECARKDRSVARLRERLDGLDRGIPAAAEVDDTASGTLELGKYLALVGLDIALIGSATAYLAQCAFPGEEQASYIARFIVPVFVLLFEVHLNERIFGGGGAAPVVAAAVAGTALVGILVALTAATVMEAETMASVTIMENAPAVFADGESLFDTQPEGEQFAPQENLQVEAPAQELSPSRRLLGWAQAGLVGVIHLIVVFDSGARIALRRLLRRLLRRPLTHRLQSAEAQAAKAKEQLAVALEDYHAEFQTRPAEEHPGPWGTDVIRAVNAIYGRVTLSPARPATMALRSGTAVAGEDESSPRTADKTAGGLPLRTVPSREFDDDGDVRPPVSRES